jgi:uncharacterized membrane protein YczE
MKQLQHNVMYSASILLETPVRIGSVLAEIRTGLLPMQVKYVTALANLLGREELMG